MILVVKMNILRHMKTGRSLVYPFFVLLAGCVSNKSSTEYWDTFTGDVFGTTYHITVQQTGEYTHLDLQHGIDSVLEEVNQVFSTYDSSTFLSAFNDNRLDEYAQKHENFKNQLSHFRTVWEVSQEVHQKTNGAFDPTAGPLFKAWGFAEERHKQSPPEISELLGLTGMNKVIVELDTLYKTDSLVELNFNAVAKGYGVDAVGQFLTHQGMLNYMVEIGGEVRTKGVNREDTCWQIGINSPDEGMVSNSVFAVIELCGTSLATSGNYRNFYFDSAGQVIGHTIDPSSGYPVIHSLKSASVIANNCATADAYATAFMVLGKEKSLRILERDSTIHGFLIFEKEGMDIVTEGSFNWKK
jgi:thiamine biosynthesis lipoprotein